MSVTSPEPEAFGRSPSSLSYCDPNNQPPATAQHAGIGTVSSSSPFTSSDALAVEKPSPRADESTTKRKHRPLSWLTFNKAQTAYPRSLSERFGLPRGQSSSSVAKSTISAPMLTSTTNTKVAEVEGVHCGELTQETFNKSTWSNKLGWVSAEDDHRTAATQARSLAERIEAEEKFQLKPVARLQKIGDALLARFRSNGGQRRGSFDMMDSSTTDQATEASKMANIQAETVNLCRDKIRNLTGQTQHYQRTRPTNLLKTTPKPGAEKWDPPLLHHGDHSCSSAALSETSDTPNFHTNDHSSQVGSLTRSFNSALDRGLLTETTNMDLIRDAAKKLGIRSKDQKRKDDLKKKISDPLPINAQFTDQHIDENNPVVPKWQAIPPPGETADVDKLLGAMPDPPKPAPVPTNDDAPEWGRVPLPEGYISYPNSPTKDKVAGPVRTRARLAANNGSEDEINPLGMHQDVGAFAEAPANVRLPAPTKPYPEQ